MVHTALVYLFLIVIVSEKNLANIINAIEKIFCNKRKTSVYSTYKPSDTVENHNNKKIQHTRPDPLEPRKQQEAMEGGWNCFKPNKLYSAPQLECSVLFSAPQDRQDMGLLEQVQKRETKMIWGLEYFFKTNGWGSWACSASRRKDWERTSSMYTISEWSVLRGWSRLFSVVASNRTRRNGQKMHRCTES